MKQLKRQRLIIKINDSQKKIPINKKIVTHLAEEILKIKGIEETELSILFVGKRRIRKLNKKFRKIDRPTDVLAFSMREGKNDNVHSVRNLSRKHNRHQGHFISHGPRAKTYFERAGVHPEILGDVVICPEIAKKSAKIYRNTPEQEIYLYLIHGILHLLGYDDLNAKRRSLMEKEQEKIFKKIAFGDNF